MVEPLAVFLRIVAAALLALTAAAAAYLEPGAAVDLAAPACLAGNGALLAAVVLDPRRGGVSLMVAFFFLFFVALPALVQIEAGVFPFHARYAASDLASGYLIVALAQLSYLAGEALADRGAGARATHRPTPPLDTALYGRAVAAMTLACAAIIAYLGPEILLITRGERGGSELILTGMRQQLLFVGRALGLLAALALAYLLLACPRLRRRSLAVLAVPAVFVPFLLLNYPPGLPRFQLMGAALAFAAVLWSFFRLRTKLVAAAAGAVFLFLFFPAIKAIGYGGGFDLAEALRRDVGAYLLRVDFDAFKQIVDTAIYLRDGTLRWGINFLGVALFFVPRALWPGKPIDSGEIVSTTLGYRYTNVSSPLPAEAFISFGLAGVVVVLLLAGLAVGRLESHARRAQESGAARQEVLLYALAMGFIVIILRGALNGVAPQFATGFLAYFALRALHDRRAGQGGA